MISEASRPPSHSLPPFHHLAPHHHLSTTAPPCIALHLQGALKTLSGAAAAEVEGAREELEKTRATTAKLLERSLRAQKVCHRSRVTHASLRPRPPHASCKRDRVMT